MDDLFRAFFGFRRRDSPFNQNPRRDFPGLDDEHDESDNINPGERRGADDFQFQSPDGAFTFSFHFPESGDMFRHFEDVFKGIGLSEFGSIAPGHPSLPGPQEPSSPRDEMLKKEETDKPAIFGQPWELPPWGRSRPQIKRDSDLDQDVESKGLDSILSERQTQPEAPMEKPKSNFSFRSVSVRTIHGPDGRIEEHRTVDDGSGKQTTVRRILGDKSHSVTTKTDQHGNEEKLENYTNLDQKDLGQFEEQWSKRSGSNRPSRDEMTLHGDPVDAQTQSIFKNIFGFSFPGFGKS